MIKAYELRIGNLVKYTGTPYPFYPLKNWSIEAEVNNNPATAVNNWIVEVEEVLCNGVNLSQGDSTLYESEKLEGIPLTPEWLEKCGAKPNVINNRWDIEYNESVYVLRLFEEGFTVGIEIEKNERFADKSFAFDIKYLHQLQNLYLALTGEELSIKETA